jgi:hypothetical protein
MDNHGYALLFNHFFRIGAYQMLKDQKDVEEGKL